MIYCAIIAFFLCFVFIFYISRHSWATLAAELDIPKETISAGLGHEIGSDVTSIYIKFDQKKVDDANRRVIDYLFGKEKAGE